MSDDTYTPPKVWKWDAESGGKFASINRPIAGPTHDKALPVGKHPLQLYSLATPNGVKVTVLLEELLEKGFEGAEYDAWLIRITEGEQFGSGFVDINPNSKIPALVDQSQDPSVRVFESGAILLYLAEKTGRFLPADPVERAIHLQWLLFALTDLAPTSSAVFYASRLDDKSAQGLFEDRLLTMFGHVERRLADAEYLAGSYGLADIALYPVFDGRRALLEAKGGLPNVARWGASVGGRAAVQKGMAVA